MGDATDRSIRDLRPAGWCLTLVCIAVTIGVACFVGPWALETIDGSLIRQRWPLFLLAIPGLLAGWLVYLGGSRALESLGIALWAETDDDA